MNSAGPERPNAPSLSSKRKTKAAKSKATTRSSRKVCQERLACKGSKPEASFCCKECATFQCEVCEELLHENSRFIFHERRPLEEVPSDQICEGGCEDKNFVDVHCVECSRKYCFACDLASHAQGAKKKHIRQSVASLASAKTGDTKDSNDADEFLSCEPDLTGKPLVDVDLEESSPVDGIDASNNRDEASSSSGRKKRSGPQATPRKPTVMDTSDHDLYPQLPDIAQMSVDHHPDLLTSDAPDDEIAVMSLSPRKEKPNRIESFLLIDEFEQMHISSSEEFAARLGCSPDNPVKVVSIFGNTGEGKSHTMNFTFFEGCELFKTSPAQSSCTIGIWAAYDPKSKVITIDTEGLLGVSENNNRRTRLLLKVLAVSDVIIYRTRAERLHNDLFTFLGDASRAYLHHFSTELKAAAQRCSFSCPISDLGPVVVVFHETLHTDVLTREHDRTPEDELRKRFQRLSLSTEAFSAFEYVGTRTVNPPTSFKGLREAMRRHLSNSTVRSARPPGVIFTALKVLNEKFSGDIGKSVATTFPDEYFTCNAQCLSCNGRCTNSMNHHRDGISHKSITKCVYQHQFENKRYYCRQCYDRGEEVSVIPKTSASSESTWVGLAKYAMSGYVLECNRCGVIYRSRQYWYGNQEPWDCVRTEIEHIWAGEPGPCQGTQNAAQKVLDSVSYLSETVSTISARPARTVGSWVADQIAPTYWIPNSRILHCGICEKVFEPTEHKHHCRACGGGFCDVCSTKKSLVPDRGWGEELVRVCDHCYSKIEMEKQAVADDAMMEVTARRVGEALSSTLGTVVSAIDFPISCIKDYARPEYWIPDSEIEKCFVCETLFNEKIAIHHCRACGNGVCDDCSLTKKPVKSRGWDDSVRVCDECNKKPNL